jgi:hypothetical protein
VIRGATAPSAWDLREHREGPQQDAECYGDGFGEKSHYLDVNSISNCSAKSKRDLSHMIAHNDVAPVISEKMRPAEYQSARSRSPTDIAYYQYITQAVQDP